METTNQPASTPVNSTGVASAYKLHKTIENTQEKIKRVKAEIYKVHLAENFAFVGTLIVYFVFIFGLYISDLWGFSSWIQKNLAEVFAIPVFATLGVTLPLAMAYIKSIAYHHLALYDMKKGSMYAIVGFLMFAGVTYEAISSSGQQQHIANEGAESSKSFQAIMGSTASVGDGGALAAQLAKAEATLAACKAKLAEGKGKDCNQSKATVDSLKASMDSANRAGVAANAAAIEAKTKAASQLKEDNFKPVYKFARDVFGVTISTGVVLVAVMVSIIFEISHGLLVLFMSQKEKYLAYLESTLIELQARYMTGTGKVHDAKDFDDKSILSMDKLREEGEIKRPSGFVASGANLDDMPVIQHNNGAVDDFQRNNRVSFGFIPNRPKAVPVGAQASLNAMGNQSVGRDFTMGSVEFYGSSLNELVNLKQQAKAKAYGETAVCPLCRGEFVKANAGQIFCTKEHKNQFAKLLADL